MSALRLQNDSLSVSILPNVGAKIYDLIARNSGYNFLWHNPRIAPQTYPIEANFDNYWCGGWDDGFPTCEACSHSGEQYPNLGELRSLHWTVEEQGESSVSLSAFGPISPIKAHKQIRLREASLESEFTIQHQGFLPIDYLWGTHPAYAVEPGCVLHIPARSGIVGQANHISLGEPGQQYPWPNLTAANGLIDMSVLQPAGPYSAGHYATDLEAGWYAIEYPQRGIGLLFEFPLDLCPYLWLWLSYGGWRGYYLAVVEPWTSYPVTLSDAVAAGTQRVLKPGEQIAFKTRITPWSSPATLASVLRENGLARR
jgi:galactose mutarotase-like enzyme